MGGSMMIQKTQLDSCYSDLLYIQYMFLKRHILSRVTKDTGENNLSLIYQNPSEETSIETVFLSSGCFWK